MAKSKYNFNAQYFDKIDSERKAYWLGFLLADGNICNNELRINLGIKDFEHLVKLRNDLESNHKFYFYISEGKQYVTLRIYSKYMYESLKKYFPPNKTKNLTKVPRVTKQLQPHFWRGVVDGDGCIQKCSGTALRYQGTPRISVTGAKIVCETFQSFLVSKDIKERKLGHFTNYSRYKIDGKDTLKVLNILYGKADLVLDRKGQLAKELLHV